MCTGLRECLKILSSLGIILISNPVYAVESDKACTTVLECSQQAVKAAKTAADQLELNLTKIQNLEQQLKDQSTAIDTLKTQIAPKAIAASFISSVDFVVRYQLSRPRYNDATCLAGEVFVGGSCIGGNPNYLAPGQSIGDGGQASVGPIFTDKNGAVAKIGSPPNAAERVVCRAYGDPNGPVTAIAVCMRPKP